MLLATDIVCNNLTSNVAHDSSRESPEGARDSLKVHTSPLKNISNVSNLSDVADKPPYPTWKCLAHLLVNSQAIPNDCIGCKRPVDMVIDHYELPKKKLVVSSIDKENFPVLAKTGFQFASHNELHSLELLGLGNQRAVQELVDLVQVKAPLLVFLAETWADEARLNYVKDRIRFDQKFFVGRINKGGGLALFWRDGIEVDVVTSLLNHIDVTVNKNTDKPWRFTGFYGELETQRRFESWDLFCNTPTQFL